jgi:hypothetical protein
MDIVTLKGLNSALFRVQTELDKLGFYDEHVRDVDVYLVDYGDAFGWQHYGTSGEINIPSVSLAGLLAVLGGQHMSLRDILRHDYAHAVADTHRALIRSARFSDAFGASHNASTASEFDKEFHITPYAATSPAEDFAETFRFYVKHGGALPNRHWTHTIIRKWSFVDDLAGITGGRQ